MYNFENTVAKTGIHYSRYIASWIKVGGQIKGATNKRIFRDWLESVGLDKDEIHDIIEMADNGKLELELNAKRFLEDETV